MQKESNTDLTPEEVTHSLHVLEQIASDRGLLELIPDEQRHQYLRAASRVAFPGRAARRQLSKALRKRRKAGQATRKSEDEALLNGTGIRQQFQQSSVMPHPKTPSLTPAGDGHHPHEQPARGNASSADLHNSKNCYMCKIDFRQIHFFYDALCPECAELNWTKRTQTCDLSGRVALITGGRVKIGFQAALKLLRAGATVVVTTRFPKDAAGRFYQESDSEHWHHRLQIYGIDLRHTRSVHILADHLHESLSQLDFVLNNACQTVRRPPGFYAHLMDIESQPLSALPRDSQAWLYKHETLAHRHSNSSHAMTTHNMNEDLVGIQQAAQLSQLALTDDDLSVLDSSFPAGHYDFDQQQIDLRDVNSWRLPLADVTTVELLEVHLVNAIAPFILNARLKRLMTKTPTRDKHIVNVSAMEGVFYRAFKTDKHPHTNMAKAALNMMTRTSAQDYVKEGIHMNSVDTGWITDEDPIEITRRKQQDHGFHPPLDIVDGAARICDPIFHGIQTGKHLWGHFLKDYEISNW